MTALEADLIAQALEAGRERAASLEPVGSMMIGPPAGYLIAEGDSWFDYPFFHDIVEALKSQHGYRIKSAAHPGDTLESMAYEPYQLARLRQVFKELSDENEDGQRTPKAVLLSAGGNDIVRAFEALLNHRASGLATINADVARGLLEVQVTAALSSLVGSLLWLSQRYFGRVLPILVHGYGYPVPDGRGYPILGLKGPWLKPGFATKGYVGREPQDPAELQANAGVMQELIDRFHDVLIKLRDSPAVGGAVRVVDLRGVFSNRVPGYLDDWNDEMHARKDAYRRAAALFAQAIR